MIRSHQHVTQLNAESRLLYTGNFKEKVSRKYHAAQALS